MIDHLPGTSFFVQALSDDDEYARQAVARAGGDKAPAADHWSPTVDLLAQISERIGLLTQVVAASNGGKLTLPPIPRPETGFDRARRALREAKHNSLVQRLTPNRD
jgi:hypothetical protein